MKYKVVIILCILILPIFCYGLTYSIFRSDANLNSNGQAVAKFIFNAESLDEFQLSLTDLKPGDNKEYPFAVSNNYSGNKSDVTVEYQISIKTYHLVPLTIDLYKLNGETEELLLTCDETYTRNERNELVCTTSIQEMGYSDEELDNYKIKVNFSSEYSDAVYSDLVDYINIDMKSWQKTKD